MALVHCLFARYKLPSAHDSEMFVGITEAAPILIFLHEDINAPANGVSTSA